MPRILMGTLTGDPSRIVQVSQELVDACIGDNAVIQLLVERTDAPQRQVIIVLDQNTTDRLVSRYELESKIWLNITKVVSVMRIPSDVTWDVFERQAPITRRRRTARRP